MVNAILNDGLGGECKAFSQAKFVGLVESLKGFLFLP